MNITQHIADGPYTFHPYHGNALDVVDRNGVTVATFQDAENGIEELFAFPARVLEVLRERYKVWTGLIASHKSLGNEEDATDAHSRRREIIVVTEALGFAREEVTGE